MNWPIEIIDKIIQFTDFQTAVSIKNAFCIKKMFNPTIHTWNWSAGGGHLEVIKWLHLNRTEGYNAFAMDFASKNGHLEIVKWLQEREI